MRATEKAWTAPLAALTALAALQGCARRSALEPPLTLSVTADKMDYRIGEPLILTARLANQGKAKVTIPAFDHTTLRFCLGAKATDVRVQHEPVWTDAVRAEPQELPKGATVDRQFLFTRLTEKEGEYALLGDYAAMSGGELFTPHIHAELVTFRVSHEVALRRDRANGLLLKTQAIELARQQAGGKLEAERAVLVPLGKTGLYTWVVMLRVAGQPRASAYQVNPYSGRVEPLELKDDGPNGPPKRESGAAGSGK